MGKATSTLRSELAGHDEAIERDREHVRQHQVSIAQAEAEKSDAAAGSCCERGLGQVAPPLPAAQSAAAAAAARRSRSRAISAS